MIKLLGFRALFLPLTHSQTASSPIPAIIIKDRSNCSQSVPVNKGDIGSGCSASDGIKGGNTARINRRQPC